MWHFSIGGGRSKIFGKLGPPTVKSAIKPQKMVPVALPAESSKAGRLGSRAKEPKPMSSSKTQPKQSTTSKKRLASPQDESEDEQDEGFMNGDGLDLGDEADTEEQDDDEEGSEEEEAFPELDSGSDGDEEESDEDEDEDSEDGSGYNSSDIERLYQDGSDLEDEDGDGSSPPTTPSSSVDKLDLPVDEKLSKLISRSTVKPNDAIGGDERISLSKDGKGRIVESKYVNGTYKREYEDYEAGYGSESSTEEVSLICLYLSRNAERGH